ncbi:MAG: apolipoprotein N-acyltransferase [Candidatus Humimicrobiaceae bacterium]
MKSYIKFILILISGALLSLSFYGPGFLAWFCLVPYLVVIHYSNLKQGVFFSFILGLVYFAGVTYWFTEYSFIFWLPIVGYLTIFTIIFGIILYFIYSKINWPALRILLISAVWLAIEFFRNRTFLAFPWGVLAYSQHNYLAIMQMTKITGIYGVSLLLILFNSAIAETIIYFIKIRKINFKYLIPVICLICLIVISGFININFYKKNFEDKDYKKINIAMVQPNISFDDKFEKDSGVIIPDRYSSKNYFKEGTELIVFPESVIWGTLEHNKTFNEWVSRTIKKENLYLIMGQILWDDKENYYNSVVLYSPNLEIIGRYNKIHPLPCGEYMPYPHILGFLSFLNVAKLNITPVREFNMINYPGKGKLGINICFESTLPVISRTFRHKGADVIFVLTDDAGFKHSIASWHHVIFSRVRAIENSSYVVHSSNMGISAIINPIGEIVSKTGLGKKEVLYETIYLNSEKSFYSRYGDIIMYIYFGFSFIFLCVYIFIIRHNKSKIAKFNKNI